VEELAVTSSSSIGGCASTAETVGWRRGSMLVDTCRTGRGLYLGIVLLAFSPLLTGCPAGTYGGVKQSQLANVVKGTTTKVELLRELGTPDQVVDLGGGREELSYIEETYTTYGVWAKSENTESWFILKKDVVEDFGTRPTTKSHKYF
jgi:hypothetical protein